MAADATDPVASGPAVAALSQIVDTALRSERGLPDKGQPLFEIRTHPAVSVTREIERGTMESLLAMPITPLEIMLGKIAPYVLVGFLQATLIIAAGVVMFGVPLVGNLALLDAYYFVYRRPTCRLAIRFQRSRKISFRPSRCR